MFLSGALIILNVIYVGVIIQQKYIIFSARGALLKGEGRALLQRQQSPASHPPNLRLWTDHKDNKLITNHILTRSLNRIIEFHRTKEAAAQFIQNLIFAVDHLHYMGFVHRNLYPENVFASGDKNRSLIIVGHEYTTQIANTNIYFYLPDNSYSIRIKNAKEGSKRPDYVSMGEIIMAWLLGNEDYMLHMKSGKYRLENIKIFIKNQKCNNHLRNLVELAFVVPEDQVDLNTLAIELSAFL